MKLIVISLLTFFCTTAIQGQAELMSKEGSKFHYKGKEYKWKDLESIFHQSENATKIYNKGKLYYNISTTMAITGMVSLGVGIGFAATDKWFEATSFFATTVALGLLSLIPRAFGDKEMRKAKDEFNFDMMKRDGYKSDTNLTLQSKDNGISLVLTF